MASAGTAPAPVSQQPQSSIATASTSFLMRISHGHMCFYWIAALTLLNSVAVILGVYFHFVLGLGITNLVDQKARSLGGVGVVLDLLISGTIAGIFVVLGSLSSKRIRWAFIAGMVLYGVDTLWVLSSGDTLSLAFHGYALYAISLGLTAVGSGIRSQEIHHPVQP